MGKTPYIDLRENFLNFLMNADCSYAQRALSLSAISSGSNYRVIDRWAPNIFNGGTWTMSRSSDVPGTLSTYPGGRSMRFEVTTADTSLLTTHMASIYQIIEGTFFQFLKKKIATMSFWVKSNKPGPYSVSFRNSSTVVDPNARCWVSPFTINAANTWEYKSIYVDFSQETTGVWNFGVTVGCIVEFNFHPGINRQTSTPNQWVSGNGGINCLSGQTNLADTVGNYIQLTQLMLTPGDPRHFQLMGVTPPSELRLCQRYYEKSFPLDFAPGTVASADGATWLQAAAHGGTTRIHVGLIRFKTEKRDIGATGRIFNHRGDFLENKLSVYNGDTNQAITPNWSLGQNGFDGYAEAGVTIADTTWGAHWTVESELVY